MAKSYRDATQFAELKQKTFFETLNLWFAASRELSKWKDEENKLRLQLADKGYFPDPVEGATNKLLLGHGKCLVLERRINRKVDETAMDAALAARTLTADDITNAIKYKAEVWDSGYKQLTPAEKTKWMGIITEEDGTPGMKIADAPKR